jgi:hypothetical protein
LNRESGLRFNGRGDIVDRRGKHFSIFFFFLSHLFRVINIFHFLIKGKVTESSTCDKSNGLLSLNARTGSKYSTGSIKIASMWATPYEKLFGQYKTQD